MRDNQPLVSICCITYNHKYYIRQAIDSFLMQEASFPIEIIIHDDASTDGTAEIVKEYAEKHPKLIIPILQSKNQYSQKQGSIYARFIYPLTCGKYIAICEGDDYWTDPLKLQKQVELIEKYPEASMCVALNKQVNTTTGKETIDYKYSEKNFPLIYFNDLNKYFHTSTYLIRKSTLDYLTANYQNLFMGDTPLRYLLINEGPFVVLNEVVSVYRITGTGIWTSLTKHSQDLIHYNIYNNFRIYHVAKRRKFYARHELGFLHSILFHKIRVGDYNNLINLWNQYVWLVIKFDHFFYLRILYLKAKSLLFRLHNKISNTNCIPSYYFEASNSKKKSNSFYHIYDFLIKLLLLC